MQNREPAGLPARTRHTSFSIAGLALLVAPRHMATFDYLDMQMIRRAREREGEREERRWRGTPHLRSFYSVRVNVSRVYVRRKGYSPPLLLPARVKPLSLPLLPKKPPTLRVAEGAHCWPLSGICMSTHFSTRERMGFLTPRIPITKLSPLLRTFECSFFRHTLLRMPDMLINSRHNLGRQMY